MYTEYVIKILELKLFKVKYLKFKSRKNPLTPSLRPVVYGDRKWVSYSDGTILDQYKKECWLRPVVYGKRYILIQCCRFLNVIWLGQVESGLSQTVPEKAQTCINEESISRPYVASPATDHYANYS